MQITIYMFKWIQMSDNSNICYPFPILNRHQWAMAGAVVGTSPGGVPARSACRTNNNVRLDKGIAASQDAVANERRRPLCMRVTSTAAGVRGPRAPCVMRRSTKQIIRQEPGEISIAGRRAGATFIGAAGLPAAARAAGWRRCASRGARAQCPHSVQTPVASAA